MVEQRVPTPTERLVNLEMAVARLMSVVANIRMEQVMQANYVKAMLTGTPPTALQISVWEQQAIAVVEKEFPGMKAEKATPQPRITRIGG